MIDLGEYKRKPARVFVNYEGWAPDAIDAALRERKKITLPDAYVRRECGCLKRLFVDAYNANRAREGRAADALLDPDECQLAVKDSSYLTFSKEPVADWEIIGDALSDSQEVWVVSRRDMEMQDVEVRRMAKVVDDAEQEVRDHMSALDYVAMTTKSREVDPREPHALLVGMGLMHLLPVRPEWTVADIKCVFARAPRSARRRAGEGSGRRAARREDGNDDALNRARRSAQVLHPREGRRRRVPSRQPRRRAPPGQRPQRVRRERHDGGARAAPVRARGDARARRREAAAAALLGQAPAGPEVPDVDADGARARVVPRAAGQAGGEAAGRAPGRPRGLHGIVARDKGRASPPREIGAVIQNGSSL